MSYHGRRAVIMGLGHFGGGAAAARWLAQQGARVTVSDRADAETLRDAIALLTDAPIDAFHLGGHLEADFRQADLVVVNPAVRPDNPLLQIARESGAQLTSEIGLFLEACPAQTIGVTGSNGKSTTAAMTAAVLRAAGRRTWLGGNIGGSLLPELRQIEPGDWVVLELSSFQLWHLGPTPPGLRIAIVTGCTPNHLDWHGTMPHYVAAKQRILAGQTAADLAVLNLHDPLVARWCHLAQGKCLAPVPLAELPPLAVPGVHNRINAACAAAAAAGAGCDVATVACGLRSFRTLSQRLEHVATIAGRAFCNDSTATTPESAIAAVESLPRPLWLLAGGRSKGSDFGPMAEAIVRRARGAAFFGETAELLHSEVLRRDPRLPCVAVEMMADAFAWCRERSQPAETIVLSPGCASTDQFRNFRHRGEEFTALVGRLSEGNGLC